jgi:hypothetical protein
MCEEGAEQEGGDGMTGTVICAGNPWASTSSSGQDAGRVRDGLLILTTRGAKGPNSVGQPIRGTRCFHPLSGDTNKLNGNEGKKKTIRFAKPSE